MAALEDEIQKMSDLQPQVDLLVKSQEQLTNEKEELLREKNIQEEKSKALEEQIENVGKTKDEVKIFVCFFYSSALQSAH